MELVKALSLKKIAVAVVLILVNCILFFSLNVGEEKNRLYDDMLKGYENQIETDTDLDYRRYIKQFELENPDIVEDESYTQAKEMFIDKVEFVYNYQNNLDSKMSDIEKYKTSSLYTNSGQNVLELIKTENDLTKVSGYETDYSSDIWLKTITEYGNMGLFIAIIMLVFIYGMQSDSKKMEYIIKSSPNGRLILEVKKIGIMAVLSCLVVFMVYSSTSIVSLFMYDGWDGLKGMAASDQGIYLVSMGVNRISWLVVNAIRATFATFVMTIFLYSLINIFENKNIGLAVALIISGIEILLDAVISEKSIFRALKYLNIRYLLNNERAWFKYNNWGYNSFVLDVQESTILFGMIVLVVSLFVIILCSRRKTEHSPNFVECILAKAGYLFNKILASMPVVFKELWKVLFKQRMIVVYAISIVFIMNYSFAHTIMYNLVQSSLYVFCENNENLTYEELIMLENNLMDEKEVMQSQKDVTSIIRQVLDEKIDAVHYVNEKHKQGADVSLISQYQYERLFDKRHENNKEILMCICLISGLFLNIGLISFEKNENVLSLIRTGKKRKSWITRKIIINATLNSIFCLGVYWYYYSSLVKTYEIKKLDVMLQSIQSFADYPLPITIREYIIVDILVMIIFVNMIVSIATYLSGYINYKTGMLVCTIINLPYVIYILGVDIIHNFTLPGIMTYINIHNGVTLWKIIVMVAVVVMGIMLNLKTVRENFE